MVLTARTVTPRTSVLTGAGGSAAKAPARKLRVRTARLRTSARTGTGGWDPRILVSRRKVMTARRDPHFCSEGCGILPRSITATPTGSMWSIMATSTMWPRPPQGLCLPGHCPRTRNTGASSELRSTVSPRGSCWRRRRTSPTSYSETRRWSRRPVKRERRTFSWTGSTASSGLGPCLR